MTAAPASARTASNCVDLHHRPPSLQLQLQLQLQLLQLEMVLVATTTGRLSQTRVMYVMIM